jgi:hypothetical protein
LQLRDGRFRRGAGGQARGYNGCPGPYCALGFSSQYYIL